MNVLLNIDSKGVPNLYMKLLSELGFESYNISPERNILGDLENSPMFSFLLPSSKNVIYNAMKLVKIPHKQQVINEVRLIFIQKGAKVFAVIINHSSWQNSFLQLETTVFLFFSF